MAVSAMHLPKPEHFRSILGLQAARARRLQWIDGALFGLAVVLTVAWGWFLCWLPFYVARLIWLDTD
jgi:hypothetical protein